ncbi:hypothetical protein [Chitinophaga ginsengisegetis]|uniref:hypothetical protein n=1 Tax=Chitinophaga ginsengisegetis TaxID=393003 RepID=UPI000DBAA646|nr:hypothetical protein [Chitinophaga ginsengisegetis]MDR6569107.1 hypothetical protein [Chitinophaga ginsengisegetis]MDR6648864.1 hypothetical protein [Chitinophaga ginsengisegetis]MDR6655188.1 hypothetical protein [Chitinophaga ginsengisegetis]
MNYPLSKYLFLAVMGCLCSVSSVQAQTGYLVEAEDFQFKGGWQVERVPGEQVSGNTILRVFSGKVKAADALTVINSKTAGTYTVWVRTPDYPANKPGTRLFQVAINEQPLEKESGQHGKEGYYWEKAGTTTLDAGENVVALQDTKGNFGRCDAILLATAGFDPNTEPLASLQRFKTAPLTVKYIPPAQATAAVKSISTQGAVIAGISNSKLRLQFLKTSGQQIVAGNSIRKGNQWIDGEGSKIFLLTAKDPQISFGSFFPSWNGSAASGSFQSRGKTFRVLAPESLTNPFLAGVLQECQPTAVKQVSEKELEVTYQTAGGQTLKGTWQLTPGAHHFLLTLTYIPKQAGYYSLAVTAFEGVKKEDVTAIQLPPMFQYQRIPDNPVMLPSAMMPQPLAIMETKQGIATFISGTPADFPLDWGEANTSPMGFAIKNKENGVQPVALSPVLGLDDSRRAAGQSITREFALGALPSGWNDALAYISDSIYKVKDYRTQRQVSLTETVFNITDLIRNDTAAGWAPELKGFYDIEADPKVTPTVVQAAPLAVVSAAVLEKDEAFFISRALPTIEYTLSRSGFRWSRGVAGTPFNKDKQSLVLSPYNSQFTTAYYEGLHQLLGEANPWLKEIALPGNNIRPAKGYSVNIPAWTQELAAYRFTKDKSWLAAATKHAKAYISTEVYGPKTTPLSKQPFYNASFYAYWWDLTDLYDLTKDTTFLHAAETSAFQTLAGIRVYPEVKDQLQTVHPGNTYDGNTTLWWKGGEKYRLGFPRKKGDAPEKQVPQSLVSPVGLGFEQPFTLFDPGKLVRPVFMSSWAPHLLRLFSEDNRTIFETYARNAVIGRFTNYPGYYATGFTDITMQPDFPFKGPDVSSVYYHHIPPHLAFTLDFLITEAMQRSHGKVNFPYGKQDGFVWFNNRVFGGGSGKVFDDETVRLWMKRGLVQIENPAVNYVTAISENRFWLLLLNESTEKVSADILLGKEAAVQDNVAAAYYATAAASPVNVPVNNRKLRVSVDGKGFSAISFPLKIKSEVKSIAPVKNGMQVLDLGAGIGKCYAFRIRSPFGWDAIYTYLESPPEAGLQATFSLNGESRVITAYPYENSFYPVNTTAGVVLKIKVTTSGGQVKEGTITFDNNSK